MCRRLLFIAALIVVAIDVSSAPAANIADFVDFSLRTSRGQVVLPGRLYAPPNRSATPRPLIVYLHGSGANGTNNVTQVEQTPDTLAAEAKRRGAILYVPQANGEWSPTSLTDSVMAMITRAVGEFEADPQRLYVTGYSNGGRGTWNMLSRHPHRFAAALAVSAALQGSDFKAANLLGTAIMAVHARDDATTPVSNSRGVVNQILTAAGEPTPTYPAASSTRYFVAANLAFPFINHFITRPDLDLLYYEQPVGGHTGLLGVYSSEGIYDWMFSHSLAVPEPSVATLLLICVPAAALALRHRAAQR